MALRTACPSFHSVIGEPCFDGDLFRLNVAEKEIEMEFFNKRESVKNVFETRDSKNRKLMMKIAAENFKMIVDNPNFKTCLLVINVTGKPTRFLSAIESILKNLKVKLKVDTFVMEYEGKEASRIRRHLDSEALKTTKLMKTKDHDYWMFGKSQHQQKGGSRQWWQKKLGRKPFRNPIHF